MANPIPIHERHSVTVVMAAQYIGISRSRIYELLADGTLQGQKVAGRRVVLVSSLLRMLGAAKSTADTAA